MSGVPDPQRRKELKRRARQQERDRLLSGMPLSLEELQRLFDFLDENADAGCDGTLRLARRFVESRGLDAERVLPWLVEQGGGCDCEVLANVAERFTP